MHGWTEGLAVRACGNVRGAWNDERRIGAAVQQTSPTLLPFRMTLKTTGVTIRCSEGGNRWPPAPRSEYSG